MSKLVVQESGKFQWSDFPNLKSAEDLENYMKYKKSNKDNEKYANLRAYYHEGFYHYTKLETIEKILEGNNFLLFHPGDSNDPAEKTIQEKEYKFYLCFSTGINENLPLWYLYSGMDGKGGQLSFTKSLIYDLLHKGKYSLVERKGADSKTILADREEILLSEDDFECTLQDVLYFGKTDQKIDLKYNTMTNHNQISCTEFEKFQNNNQEFVKSLIWYYEKETRLLVKLTEKGTRHLKDGKFYAIKLSFGHLENVRKKMKLVLAPEVETMEGYIKNEDYPHIYKFLFDTSNVKLSKHKGEVKMNLCKNCTR